MATIALRYGFRQPFRSPAAAAFEWCTDFRSGDAALFGDRRQRVVRRLTEDTFVFAETTYPDGRRRRIHRLVRIFPERRSWTSTHLDGPFRYSQFWYRVVSDGARRSHLEFEGLKLETRPRALGASVIARLAEAEGRADARTWRTRLAPALDRDLAR